MINNLFCQLFTRYELSPSKARTFELNIDYLLSANKAPDLAVKEILGLIKSDCTGINNLSTDFRHCLFSQIIGREQTYLICIFYLKSTAFSTFDLNEINAWLRTLLGPQYSYKIEKNYFHEICVNGHVVGFGGKFPAIDIDKYILKPSLIQAAYSKRTKNLPADCELYKNANGYCLGAANYWLYSMAKAYTEAKLQRYEIKNKYVNTLLLSENMTGVMPKDDITSEKIRILQNEVFLNSKYFLHLQDLETTNLALMNELGTLLELLETTKDVPGFYLQILSHEHAIAMILVRKAGQLKIICYDPSIKNNQELYSKIVTTATNAHQAIYKELTGKIPYLSQNQNHELPLIFRVYTAPYVFAPKPCVTSYITETNKEEWLYLGLSAANKAIVIKTLDMGADIPDAYIIAVQANNIPLVQILQKYAHLKSNYKDRDDCSALDYAIMKNDINMFNLLFQASDLSKEDQILLLETAEAYAENTIIPKQIQASIKNSSLGQK